MKIKSVVKKTVVVVNGKSHTIIQSDWTESIRQDVKAGRRYRTLKDVVDWVAEDSM